jgi:hypothetical protein
VSTLLEFLPTLLFFGWASKTQLSTDKFNTLP